MLRWVVGALVAKETGEGWSDVVARELAESEEVAAGTDVVKVVAVATIVAGAG